MTEIKDGKVTDSQVIAAEQEGNREVTRRKASLQGLKDMISPIKEFPFKNPQDPNDIIVFTARKLSPGHLLSTHNTAFLKAYHKKKEEESVENEQDDDQKEAENKEAFEKIISEVEYSAEIASLSILDPETMQNYLTTDEVMQYVLPEWHSKISSWALGGASPQDTENPDEIDTFPEQSN